MKVKILDINSRQIIKEHEENPYIVIPQTGDAIEILDLPGDYIVRKRNIKLDGDVELFVWKQRPHL